MPVINLTDNNFKKEVLEAKKPVLIDFWAIWCGPCQMQGPIVEELAEEIGDKAKIAKLNVDESPEVASQYSIMSIPTIKIFKDGKDVETFIGVQTKEVLTSTISKYF